MKTIALPAGQSTREDAITETIQALAELDIFTLGTETGETDRLYFTGCSEKFYIKVETEGTANIIINFYNPLGVKIGHPSNGIGGQRNSYTTQAFFSYHKTAQGSVLFGYWSNSVPVGGINAALIVPEGTGQHWIGMTYELNTLYITLENLTAQYNGNDALPYTRPLDLNISNVVIGKALWEKLDIVFDNLYMVYRGGIKPNGGLRSVIINGKKYTGFIIRDTVAYSTNFTTFFVLDDETLI